MICTKCKKETKKYYPSGYDKLCAICYKDSFINK